MYTMRIYDDLKSIEDRLSSAIQFHDDKASAHKSINFFIQHKQKSNTLKVMRLKIRNLIQELENFLDSSDRFTALPIKPENEVKNER